jgi:hypothetical protein
MGNFTDLSNLDSTKSGSKIAEIFGKTSALGASLFLISSVIYDRIFFFALGINFLNVPTTLADHIRTSLIWAPTIIPVLLLYILFRNSDVLDLFEHKKIYTSFIAKKSDKKTIKTAIQELWLMALITFSLWMWLGDELNFMVALTGFFLWAYIVVKCITIKIIPNEEKLTQTRMTALLVGLYICVLGSYAWEDAKSSYFRPMAKVKTNNSIAASQGNGILGLRGFEQFMLVKDESNVIHLLKNEDILSIEYLGTKASRNDGALCLTTGWLCSNSH